VVLSLLVATMPSLAVFADTEGTSSGSFVIGGTAPVVNDFETYSDAECTSAVDDFTPQVTYYAKVGVSDANTVNDIQVVTVKMYYNANVVAYADESTISEGHTQTAAIMTWTKATGEWKIDAGSGPPPTSWAIVQESCKLPESTSATTGEWVFAFKVGKVASESLGSAGWMLHARVLDGTSRTAFLYSSAKQVFWYGEINVKTTNVNFGIVTPGTGFADNVNEVNTISLKMISNGEFYGNGRVSDEWTGSNSANVAAYDEDGFCANANEFSLMTWGVDDFSKAKLIPLSGTNLMLNDPTGEAGVEKTGITAWLKLSDVFIPDTYSGTVYYSIVPKI